MEGRTTLFAKELNIINFRNFRNVKCSLGEKITVISGQNGVGKSTLLSLIASSCGLNKSSRLGRNFQPEFAEYFHIDEKEKFENYEIYLTFNEAKGARALTKKLDFKNDTNSKRGIRIIPRTTKEPGKPGTMKEEKDRVKSQYNVGPDARIKKPSLYLSLSRLYPLGEQNNTVSIISIKKTNPLYKKAYKKFTIWYNSVIPNSIQNEAELSIVEKSTCSRASFHMDQNNTPILSQSVGQDNLGNIISALVDLYLLSLEENYEGALLCIDEIDVSLHPDTQIRLLTLLKNLSEELNLQIVLTTHSLTILKEILKKEKSNYSSFRLIYLKSPSSPFAAVNKDYYRLKADLFSDTSYTPPKVKIFFEDSIAIDLFNLNFS